jgi:hypothetical protein
MVPAGSVEFDVIVSPATIVKLNACVAVCCGLPESVTLIVKL